MTTIRESPGNGSAVTRVVTLRVAPEHEARLLELADRLVEQVVADEPDTLLYVVTKHPTDPHTYVWGERHRDEAALTSHAEQPYVRDALEQVSRWLLGEPEVLSLTPVVPS